MITKPRVEGGLGIRPMRLTNDALLAKLGWHLLQLPDTLWSRVIRGKYYRSGSDIDIFTRIPRASCTWKVRKSLLKAFERLLAMASQLYFGFIVGWMRSL